MSIDQEKNNQPKSYNTKINSWYLKKRTTLNGKVTRKNLIQCGVYNDITFPMFTTEKKYIAISLQ